MVAVRTHVGVESIGNSWCETKGNTGSKIRLKSTQPQQPNPSVSDARCAWWSADGRGRWLKPVRIGRRNALLSDEHGSQCTVVSPCPYQALEVRLPCAYQWHTPRCVVRCVVAARRSLCLRPRPYPAPSSISCDAVKRGFTGLHLYDAATCRDVR